MLERMHLSVPIRRKEANKYEAHQKASSLYEDSPWYHQSKAAYSQSYRYTDNEIWAQTESTEYIDRRSLWQVY